MRALCLLLCALLAGWVTAAAAEPAVDYGEELPIVRVPEVEGGAMAVQLVGQTLYVLGREELYIFDVSIPDAPKRLAKVRGLHQARQLAVSGTLAVISARATGLWFVDVRDPAKPVRLPRGDSLELATGLAAAGRYAFVGDRIYGIEILDIADPAAPVYLSRLKTQEAQSVVYDHGRLYAGNWAAGKVTVIDIADPRRPREVSQIDLLGFGDGLAVRGDKLYAATGHHRKSGSEEERFGNGHGLEIFDIADPRRPERLARLEFPPLFSRGNDYWTVRVSGDFAYTADSYNGLFIHHVADPRHPRAAARVLLPKFRVAEFTFEGERRARDLPDACTGVAVGEGVVYVTGMRSGLSFARFAGAVPDAYDPGAAPELPPAVPAAPDQRFHVFCPGSQIRGVAVDGDLAWVAASRGGLYLVRLSERGIAPVRHWPQAWCYEARRRGDLLITAEGEGGVAVYRIGADRELTRLGGVKLPNHAPAQRIWAPAGSRFAVAASHGGAVWFIDLADPARPRQVLQHSQPGMVYGDLVSPELIGGRYLLQNWHVGGFAWYDLGGETPKVANAALRFDSRDKLSGGVAAFRGKAFATLGSRRFVLLEPNEPPPTTAWKTYPLPEPFVGTPRFDGDLLVLSNRARGRVAAVDMSDPAAAKAIPARSYQLEGCPETVGFWRHRMVIPAGYQGLLLEKASVSLP